MNNLKWDKITRGSLIANGLFVVAFVILLRYTGCNRPQPCVEVSRRSDTLTRFIERTDTLYKTIAAYTPVAKEVRPGKQEANSCGEISKSVNTDQQHSGSAMLSLCSDTLIYSDSIYRTHEFKAVINDLITGNRLAQRSIQWADLTPITERIVTNTITVEKKQPLVKVYLGAAAGLRYESPLTRGGIDIAPAGSLIFSDRYMVDVGYYILGGEVTAGVKVKLSFRK